jgi:hypothetical protein
LLVIEQLNFPQPAWIYCARSLTHLAWGLGSVVLSQIFLWLSTSYTRGGGINECKDKWRDWPTNFWCFSVLHYRIAMRRGASEKIELFVLLSGKKRRQSRAVAAELAFFFCVAPRSAAGFVDKVDWNMLGVRSLASTCLFLPIRVPKFSPYSLSSFGIPRVWLQMQNIHFYTSALWIQ